MQLVIATHNVHKLREYKSLLRQLVSGCDLLSLRDFPSYHLPPEEGDSFETNAIHKAVHAAQVLDRLVLADDSGLVIPALQGAPGVFSSRYAGKSASDKDNRQKLLSDMRELTDVQRDGYFECWIALASPKGLQKVVSGMCQGSIAFQEKGGQGFGYDPIFIKHEYGKTFAEMDEETKNRVSHRRKALDKMIPFLQNLVAESLEAHM